MESLCQASDLLVFFIRLQQFVQVRGATDFLADHVVWKVLLLEVVLILLLVISFLFTQNIAQVKCLFTAAFVISDISASITEVIQFAISSHSNVILLLLLTASMINGDDFRRCKGARASECLLFILPEGNNWVLALLNLLLGGALRFNTQIVNLFLGAFLSFVSRFIGLFFGLAPGFDARVVVNFLEDAFLSFHAQLVIFLIRFLAVLNEAQRNVLYFRLLETGWLHENEFILLVWKRHTLKVFTRGICWDVLPALLEINSYLIQHLFHIFEFAGLLSYLQDIWGLFVKACANSEIAMVQ